MVLLDCLTTITLLESKDQRRELEWQVPQWATKARPGMLSVQWLEANTNRQATGEHLRKPCVLTWNGWKRTQEGDKLQHLRWTQAESSYVHVEWLEAKSQQATSDR